MKYILTLCHRELLWAEALINSDTAFPVGNTPSSGWWEKSR